MGHRDSFQQTPLNSIMPILFIGVISCITGQGI